jgi:hypothetical protein
MSRIKCFWLEALDECRYWLRTYESVEGSKCPVTGSYHNGMTALPDGKMERYEDRGRSLIRCIDEPKDFHNSDYPSKCDCGFEFTANAYCHVFHRQLFLRTDTGEKMTAEDAPVGAMWDAWYYPKAYRGSDGISLMVKTPGGEWCVDARCSNCTLPDDNEHKCWVRHGSPPDITVDKNGKTCSAGAGSIAQPRYHGFLRNGYLEQC